MKNLLGLVLLSLPLVSNSTSFDCSRAKGMVEITICNSHKLSRLDSELARFYTALSKDVDIKQQQRDWLNSRNHCATSANIADCIEKSYLKRLKEFHALNRGKFSIPVSIQTRYSLNSGDWYPLPEKDMKAAAVDTALSKLSETGYFSLLQNQANKNNSTGLMDFNISLIGPAEVAKLTIQLSLPNQPSFVSTSSISVKGLDHQGIYKAFEHIGQIAAKQMLAKFNAYVMHIPEYRLDDQIDPKDDKRLQSLYDLAQGLKSQYKYQEARLIFEKIANSDDAGGSNWKKLAQEELRYGLLIFEAKQSMVSMGSPTTGPDGIRKNNLNAQNLLRQILAENTDNVQRMMEAQGMLDELDVSRNALDTAMQARSHGNQMLLERGLRSIVARKMMMAGMGRDLPDGICEKSDFRSLRNFDVVRQNADKSFIVKDKVTSAQYRVKCGEEEVEVTIQ